MSVLQRCPFYRGVRLIEVSVLQRCPYYRGVHLIEVSILQRCPSYGGIRFTEVSIKRELTVPVKKIYTTFYEISKQKVALIQEFPPLLRPQPVCGGRRGRGSQATESSTGIPKKKDMVSVRRSMGRRKG